MTTRPSSAGHTTAGTVFTQTYSTADPVVPAATVEAVATTAATNSTPFGFSEAQANAIPVAINALAADVLALRKALNAVIDELQAVGTVD